MSWCVSWCLCVFTCSSSLDSVQDGSTALHMASQKGHCEIVRMLLEAKADVNMKSNVSESCSSDDYLTPRLSSVSFCIYSQLNDLDCLVVE